MKKSTSFVIGNASTGNNNIHFRKTSFLTESNRTHLEECVRTFIAMPIPLAFHTLVKMTCCPKEDIPVAFWEDIQLNPDFIPNKAWDTFVNELRYQYKITHPTFMTEFTVPSECLAAYDALSSDTSEIAAYMFYKKANTFLYNHIRHAIGKQHISDTFNRLAWHSRDDEVNRIQQLKGLRRLSLREYEAIYFYNHLKKCTSLLQSMQDYMQKDEQPTVMEPAKKEYSKNNDLPFFISFPDDKAVTQTVEKTSLEINKENILAYETDFFNFVFNNDEDSLNRLHNVGFNMNQLRFKAVAISRVLRAHREMIEAIEALSK